MLLFVHRGTYIRVIGLKSMGCVIGHSTPTDNLGKIFRVMKGASAGITGRVEWVFDGCYRNKTCYWTDLNPCEKRQLIGLLDDLNGVIGRPQEDYRNRFEQIIGPEPISPMDR
jgi:hypothetical protein